MNDMMVFWLIVVIISIAIEAFTLGLTSIWFAGGALAALLVSVFDLPLAVQIIVFFVVTVVLLYFTRPVAVRYFNKNRVKTNLDSMIGRQAIVISEIDNLQGVGQVTVGGQEWTARSVDESVIAVGTVVEIMAISGVKLMVKPDPQMEKVELKK